LGFHSASFRLTLRRVMFEIIKPQIVAAAAKLTQLRRFL
jgi:hypothetical protein